MVSISTRTFTIPPASYFWKWSDDGSAIEWPDGQTLAFSQEIFAILSSLAEEGGIPPLGSLLLVHAASSGQLEHFKKILLKLIELYPEEFTSYESQTLLSSVTHSLSRIAELPEELRHGTRAKAQLCHALFQRTSWEHKAEKARLIVQDLLAEPSSRWSNDDVRQDFAQRFLRDTSILIQTTAGLHQEELEELIRTGIEFPDLSPAEFDEPIFEEGDSRTLLEQLAEDGSELSALAGIAKQVISLVSLPLPATKNNDLPIGGIADIVNRGTPDKLLTTELAWDDTVLATRLAQNEALFYHRETPPQNTPSERLILLDHGLRYWGLGRLFALATHLGLRCHSAAGREVKVTNFIASKTSALPFPLETSSDVRAALSYLPTHLSFAPALRDLTSQILQAEPEQIVRDIFIITSAPSLADPETATNLHTLTSEVRMSGGRLYVIELTPSGNFTLSEHRARGIRKLQEGLLNLDDLLPEKEKRKRSSSPNENLNRVLDRASES